MTSSTPSPLSSRDLSHREKIVIAASTLGPDTFPHEELVVRCWELFQDSFALRGYPQHPDANRVAIRLAGRQGVMARGWLEIVQPKVYRMTEAGRRFASSLASDAPRPSRSGRPVPPPRRPVAKVVPLAPPVAPPATSPAKPREKPALSIVRAQPPAAAPTSLSDGEASFLSSLALSPTFGKLRRGVPLAREDADAFFRQGASPQDVDKLIARAAAALDSGAVDPRLPSVTTCFSLLNLSRLLLAKFARK